MTRTRQVLLFLGACTFSLGCGGDDDDGIIIADSSPSADAGPDASVACGDFDEAADDSNSLLVEGGEAEDSGVTFAAGDTKVICGVVDPDQLDEENEVTDSDAFTFDVGAEDLPLRVVLTTEEEASNMAFILFFLPEGGSPVQVAVGGFFNGYALTTSQLSAAGTWQVLLIHGNDPENPLAAPIHYQFEIVDRIPCAPAAGDATFTEANDGARSRRNDMVSAAWANDPVTKLTTPTTDNPEPTEITLEAGTPVKLTGTSADIAARDDYHDKDSYLVTTDDDVNEIDVVLSWPDGEVVDMDVMTFVAETGDPDLGGAGGAFIDTLADELVTSRVPSGAPIWVWAGSYTGAGPGLPVDYDITICPRAFTP